MKIALVFSAIWVVVVYTTVLLCGHFMYGNGYVSESTEEKYLRNINKLETRDADYFYMSYKHSDSLTSIHRVFLDDLDFSHKWYIMDDVGVIRPSSKLSLALDSLSRQFKKAKNKYK